MSLFLFSVLESPNYQPWSSSGRAVALPTRLLVFSALGCVGEFYLDDFDTTLTHRYLCLVDTCLANCLMNTKAARFGPIFLLFPFQIILVCVVKPFLCIYCKSLIQLCNSSRSHSWIQYWMYRPCDSFTRRLPSPGMEIFIHYNGWQEFPNRH